MTHSRCNPRIREKNIVRITVVRVPEEAGLLEDTIFSVSRDVSVGGLSFSTLTPPAVGTRLNLRVLFSSPSRIITNLVGRVAWVGRAEEGHRYKVGVDFSESSARARAQWKRTVARRLAEKAAPRGTGKTPGEKR